MNKITQNAIDIGINCILKTYEGLSLIPYLCPAGKPTIAYGNTMYENGTVVTMMDKPITEDRAKQIMEYHLYQRVIPELQTLLYQLKDQQNGALISFVYNLGETIFRKSRLKELINVSPADKNIKYCWLSFNKIKKGNEFIVLNGLTQRREWEYQIYSCKIYNNTL